MKSVNTSTVSLPSLHCVHEDMQDCNVLAWCAWCALTPEPQGRSLCRMSKSTGWSRSSTIQVLPLGLWAATCTCTHPRNQDQASFENAIVCITDFLSPVICWQTPMLIVLGIVSSAVMNMGMQPSLWYANLLSFRELPEVGLGPVVALILVFWSSCILASLKPVERISRAAALAYELFWPLLHSFMKIWVWLALPVSLGIQLHLCFHGA